MRPPQHQQQLQPMVLPNAADERLQTPGMQQCTSSRKRGGAAGPQASLPESGGGDGAFSRSVSEARREAGTQLPREQALATPSEREGLCTAGHAGHAGDAGHAWAAAPSLLQGCSDAVGALVGLGALFLSGFAGFNAEDQGAAMQRRVVALMRVAAAGVPAQPAT
jgi:hypothetical protein